MTRPGIPPVALLPLRIFFGLTFLWAGLDKLLDPTFFDPGAATSIHAQLTAFARSSPLGDLIRDALPFAAPIGLAIAVAELGIGIGALTGIAFRVAAIGGFALSILFWLTASWPTHPYYFGADLPYAIGWLTLAMAGHGDRLALAGTAARDDAGISPQRRLLLQTGTLAALAAILASVTAPLRAIGIASEPTPTPSPSPTPASSPTPAASQGAAGGIPAPTGAVAGRLPIARVADVQRTGAAAFTVPFDAPAPLPAGDPGLVIQLADQSFVAFDAVCTHAGCTVEYDAVDAVIFCPCHGAEFDPARDAAVIDGPTRQALASLPLVVDPESGTISLATS